MYIKIMLYLFLIKILNKMQKKLVRFLNVLLYVARIVKLTPNRMYA